MFNTREIYESFEQHTGQNAVREIFDDADAVCVASCPVTATSGSPVIRRGEHGASQTARG
jgi:hypothetical protein